MEEKMLQSPDPVVPEKTETISFLFHLITIAITCTIIFFLVQQAIKQPTPKEDKFLIKPLTPLKLSESGNAPAVVRTGISINNFREFDLVANSFIFEGVIWFEFDPSLISLDTISNFSFQKAEIKFVSAPKTHLEGRRLLVRYDIVVKFSTEIDYSFFPLDDHMLALVLVNKTASPHEMIFESDNRQLVVDVDTASFGWINYYHQVFTGYTQQVLDSLNKSSYVDHPAAQFSIFYIRTGLKYALILLMPMVVFIIVMLTAFSYDPKKNFSSIMVANGASLSGLIGFRFVIENMSPKVGYFMISDLMFLIFLAIAASLFLIGIFSTHLSVRVKKIIILLVDIILILSFSIIIWHVLSFSFYVSEIF